MISHHKPAIENGKDESIGSNPFFRFSVLPSNEIFVYKIIAIFKINNYFCKIPTLTKINKSGYNDDCKGKSFSNCRNNIDPIRIFQTFAMYETQE